jgi:hypothetical protein
MGHRIIGALIVIALVVGVVGVAPAMAAEGPLGSEESGTLTITPIAPGDLGTAGTGAAVMPAAAAINCSTGQVCAWAQYGAGGQESVWAASNTGCHNHENNAPLRSGYNGSPYTERVGGYGNVPRESYWEASGPVYGELCWPV